MKRLLTLVLIALVAYAAGYAYVRTAWAQKRALDGVTYVVYPTDRMWSYYLWRPAAYVDAMATGMASHIGPHPEETKP